MPRHLPLDAHPVNGVPRSREVPRGHPMDRPRVARDVSLALLLKAAALAALYWLFFGPAHQPVIDAGRVAAHLIASAPPAHDAGGER